MNVWDAFYEVLRAHGITTIFGNPGSNELIRRVDGGTGDAAAHRLPR
jgi:hypothetical protein